VILHKLIIRFIRHKDDIGFYRIQAQDTVRWLEKAGVRLDSDVSVLDLGCGHGLIGGGLIEKGCKVTFADEQNWLLPQYGDEEFRTVNIEEDDIGLIGKYDLVICSNVLEHVANAGKFVESIDRLLKPGGRFYLSWTNWLSPWGGHEYSPFHYLGRRRGHLVYDRVVKHPRKHTPYENLFPTSIGKILGAFRRNPELRVLAVAPRYYPEFSFVMRVPLIREFMAWNCAILLERAEGDRGLRGEMENGKSTTMNDQRAGRNGGRPQTRILALLWHAPHYVISAGGFKRTYEIFKRVPADASIVAIDNSPSFLADIEGDGLRVIEYRVPQLVRRLEQQHFIVERLAEWMVSTLLITLECVRLRLRGERFDVIFVPSSEQLPALLGGIVARFLFNTKLVACNMNIEWFSQRARPLVIRAHNQADLLITLSRDLRKTLRHSGTGIPVVINGVGLDTQCIERALAGAPEEKLYDAVFVGRHDREKGILDLIEIWSMVAEQRPGAQLVMVGSCNPVNNAILTAQIARFGMADNITLAGVVDEVEKFGIMKSSRLCLFPSHMEGWGIVPQEALACGLPVLIYDLPVYRENIRDCDAVFAVPVGDVSAMAETALSLLAEDRLEQYEDSGPLCVSQFCWDAVARREFDILAGTE